MRIALLPSAYAPMVGGVEELTRSLARQLVAAGDEVEVWTTRPAGTPGTSEVDGVVVRRFDMVMPPRRLGPVVRFPVDGGRCLASLVGAARAFRPDIVHVQCFGVNGAYAAVLASLARLPLVVTLQGETVMDDHDIYERAVSLRVALRLGLARARAVTGCSQFVLDDAIRRFGLAPHVGKVIYNGVDVRAPSAPRDVPLPFERFVLCLGRVVRKKGFDLLIDAFPAVAERFPDVGLVVGGDGRFREELERRVAASPLADRVHFTGTLDQRQVDWVMRRAEVFVMPSRVEPFGIVTLEAWRAGCPVVVSSMGGAPEFVTDDVDGLVVDPTDRAALTSALIRLLGDEELRRRLSAVGARSVERFDWSVIARQYRDVYAEALRSETSPTGRRS